MDALPTPLETKRRFPALSRLGWRWKARRIPYVQQQQWTDCGAACLTMVLAYHGHETKLDEVRTHLGIGHDGVDALSILRAAESYGMRGRGLRLDAGSLEHLPQASILHWEFNHFVVFESLSRDGVRIVDPAHGRRLLSMEAFRRSFTGVAVTLEPGDNFQMQEGDHGHLWRYARRALSHRGLLTRILTISLILRAFALALPIFTGLIIDRVVPRGDYHLLAVAAAGFAAMIVGATLSSLVRSYMLLQLRTNLDTRMTLGFVDYLVKLPYSFFQQRSAGDLLMRVNSNETIRDMLTSQTLSILLDGHFLGLYLLFIFFYSPVIAALVIAIALIKVVVFLLSRRTYADLMSESLDARAKAQSYLVQLVGGIETLKATGAEAQAVEHWSNLFVDELNVSLRQDRLNALVGALVGVVAGLAPMAVLGYGAVLVMDGALTLGTMLALNALAGNIITPLSSLVSSALSMQNLRGYLERIDDVLSSPPEQDIQRVEPAPKLSGSISLQNVSFSYSPQLPPVVQEVSLDVLPGMSIAIVGRSGSGKSTLAKLLAGLYQPSSGRICFDGRDLAELDVRSVRRQLGIVMQDPFLFSGSIRRNISLADPSLGLDRIVHAAKLACIHDDISAKPMGYESVVADGGASLSGGQRQRLALARALVHKPSILLLDEATSALDTATEAQVMRNIETLGCTRIIIAHRLSTIVHADLILVMEQGHLVDAGTHRDLIQRDGIYRELIAAQTTTSKGDMGHDGQTRMFVL